MRWRAGPCAEVRLGVGRRVGGEERLRGACDAPTRSRIRGNGDGPPPVGEDDLIGCRERRRWRTRGSGQRQDQARRGNRRRRYGYRRRRGDSCCKEPIDLCLYLANRGEQCLNLRPTVRWEKRQMCKGGGTGEGDGEKGREQANARIVRTSQATCMRHQWRMERWNVV